MVAERCNFAQHPMSMAARWCGVPRVNFLMQAMQVGANFLENNQDDFVRETALERGFAAAYQWG